MSIIIAIDEAVNSALGAIRVPIINKLFWAISASLYLVLAGVLFYFFFVKPVSHRKKTLHNVWTGIKYPYAWALFATYAVLFLVLGVMKQQVARVRPNVSNLLSFPSRHAAFAFFIAITFPTSRTGKIVLYSWAVLIGISRLVLAEHWLSDVVFGAGLGLLAGLGFKKALG